MTREGPHRWFHVDAELHIPDGLFHQNILHNTASNSGRCIINLAERMKEKELHIFSSESLSECSALPLDVPRTSIRLGWLRRRIQCRLPCTNPFWLAPTRQALAGFSFSQFIVVLLEAPALTTSCHWERVSKGPWRWPRWTLGPDPCCSPYLWLVRKLADSAGHIWSHPDPIPVELLRSILTFPRALVLLGHGQLTFFFAQGGTGRLLVTKFHRIAASISVSR